MSTADELNVTVVGCGRWGRNIIRTLQNLRQSKGVRIQRLVSTGNKDNKSIVEREFGLECTQDLGSAFDRCDALFVASPDETHYEIAKRSLDLGIPTFVEKPLAQEFSQVVELVELSRSNRTLLTAGHVMVFHPFLERIRQALKESKETVMAIYSSRLESFSQNGGKTVLRSSLVHDIAMIDSVLGKLPDSVSYIGFHSAMPQSEHLSIQLHYPGQLVVQLVGSSIWPYSQRDFTLWTESRVYSFDGVTNRYRVGQQATQAVGKYDTQVDEVIQAMPLTTEIENFLDAVRTPSKPLKVDGEHIIRVMKTIDLIENSPSMTSTR
jgi:predicted dehydrogenase